MDSYFPSTTINFKTYEVARQLHDAVGELQQKLQEERQRLRPHGVGLPVDTLTNLDTIFEEFDKLSTRVRDNQNELLQLRSLANTIEMMNSSLDLNEVLRGVMDRMVQLVGAERGVIVLVNEETGDLEVKIARKIGTMPGRKTDDLLFSTTVVRQVIETNEPLLSTDPMEDSRLMAGNPDNSIIGFNLRSILCVPLTFRDKVIGAVYCDNRAHTGIFSKRELRMLSAFANHAAIAIENARLFEQIRTTLDEITEIKTLLNNILASIASGVLTTDIKETVTIYNTAAETIFGQPAPSAIGKTLDAALPSLYYHLRKGMLQKIRLASEIITEEAELEFETRGRINLNLQLTTLKSADNRPQGLALVADDLTELKRRDAQLAAVRRYLPPVMVDNIQAIDRLALGGERRTVTALFVEVRSFDTFDASLSPRRLMEALNTYLTIASEGIHHHAGLIDKYMGSEIMALFNSQLNPAEDHAWQAVQAALRMASDLKTFARHMQGDTDRCFYRVGIHSGIATVGNVGSAARREFSAIGDNINLAKRLQENAKTEQILISEDTLDHCAHEVKAADWLTIRAVGDIEVKGRVRPATVYEIQHAD